MEIEATAMGLAPALALRLEVEDFLYREAELVDDRKFEEWLQLFADDLEYRVPMARNLRHDKVGDEYLSRPLDVYWIDESKETLAARVAQIRTGVHWAEEPLSRTAHLVTNVRVVRATPSAENAQELEVSCKFLIYRNRNTDEEDTLIGKRVDTLRRSGGSWLISRRTVYIAQSVLLAKSLSFVV
jgi:3-phenylpropionate/cinnamic acid dioxygenase small subunit